MREGERKRARAKRRKLKRNEKPQRFIHRKIDHLFKALGIPALEEISVPDTGNKRAPDVAQASRNSQIAASEAAS